MTPPRCDPNAIRRRGWWDVRFHMPRYGGWKKYVVVALQPKLAQQGHWFIGWTDHCTTAGVSLVPITERKVRVLLGPDDVSFFGLDAEGYQIKVAIFGSGTIGDGGPYAQLPLY